jgi:flagellar hook protein FlgE
MGIFGALTTSVAGLRANSYALENISGNIANSQTTAFKRIDTSFMDIIPDTGANAQLAGSVTAGSRSTNTIAGSVQAAAVSTYMAINGEGFFAVQKPGSFSDNNPVFDGVNRYTRRGDFSLDKNGYLVNGAGYYLEGVPIDPTTGNPSGSVPQVLRFQNDFLPSQATTKIDYRANLASYPLTNKHDTSVPGSELLRPADFLSNPRILGTPATPFSNTAVMGNNRNDFQTIPQPISQARCSQVRPAPTRFLLDLQTAIRSCSRPPPAASRRPTHSPLHRRGACSGSRHHFYRPATATVGGLLTTIDGLTGASPVRASPVQGHHAEFRYRERLYACGRFVGVGGSGIPGARLHGHHHGLRGGGGRLAPVS